MVFSTATEAGSSLKGIPEPVHVYQVYSELDAPRTSNSVLMFFGKPREQLGWKLGAAVVALAALTAPRCRLPHDRGRGGRWDSSARKHLPRHDGTGGARR